MEPPGIRIEHLLIVAYEKGSRAKNEPGAIVTIPLNHDGEGGPEMLSNTLDFLRRKCQNAIKTRAVIVS